jgi:hypothetical protein
MHRPLASPSFNVIASILGFLILFPFVLQLIEFVPADAGDSLLGKDVRSSRVDGDSNEVITSCAWVTVPCILAYEL